MVGRREAAQLPWHKLTRPIKRGPACTTARLDPSTSSARRRTTPFIACPCICITLKPSSPQRAAAYGQRGSSLAPATQSRRKPERSSKRRLSSCQLPRAACFPIHHFEMQDACLFSRNLGRSLWYATNTTWRMQGRYGEPHSAPLDACASA